MARSSENEWQNSLFSVRTNSWKHRGISTVHLPIDVPFAATWLSLPQPVWLGKQQLQANTAAANSHGCLGTETGRATHVPDLRPVPHPLPVLSSEPSNDRARDSRSSRRSRGWCERIVGRTQRLSHRPGAMALFLHSRKRNDSHQARKVSLINYCCMPFAADAKKQKQSIL